MAVPRPSKLPYNDLSGSEMVDVLTDWFRNLLREHELLQPHRTLPHARITLDVRVGIDMFTGGAVPFESAPDHVDIAIRQEFENEVRRARAALASDTDERLRVAAEAETERLERERTMHVVINGAPIEGGKPPDQLRTEHGLPVPRPGFGPRGTGSHMFLADVLPGMPKPQVPASLPVTDPILLTDHSALVPPVAPATDSAGGRRGEVAEGYVFSSEVSNSSPTEQHMPADRGEISIELAGKGIQHDSGMRVMAPTSRASVREQGDERGEKYTGVHGVYDPGPRGLIRSNRQGGYGTDGRPRISFGNNHRGS
jgi:hypothetical protein